MSIRQAVSLALEVVMASRLVLVELVVSGRYHLMPYPSVSMEIQDCNSHSSHQWWHKSIIKVPKIIIVHHQPQHYYRIVWMVNRRPAHAQFVVIGQRANIMVPPAVTDVKDSFVVVYVRIINTLAGNFKTVILCPLLYFAIDKLNFSIKNLK